MDINTVYNIDNLDFLKQLPDCCIDLIVTSPPYSDLRKYKGFTWDFEAIAFELKRCLKPDGFICWNEASSFMKKDSSIIPFKHLLFFVEQVGLTHHETLIYAKKTTCPGMSVKYKNSHEYVFVFSKTKNKNKNLIKRKTKNNGIKKWYHAKHYDTTKNRSSRDQVIVHEDTVHGNVFFYNIGWMHSYKDKIAVNHSAVMNISLAKDLVYTYSNKNDIVFDPFGGSGTTAVAAKVMGRNFIITEISSEYSELAKQRIQLFNHSEDLSEYDEARNTPDNQMYMDMQF